MLKTRHRELDGLRITVSGSGNVAQYAALKAIELGATVLTFSDSGGTLYNPAGFTTNQWEQLVELKEVRRGRLAEFAGAPGLEYVPGGKPWGYPCDVALPCATQNELDDRDALALIGNGCFCVGEGANMPSTLAAVDCFQAAQILYAPGKAANAGGVAVSGLEMSQNALRMHWTEAEVDEKLHAIMRSIHQSCVRYGAGEGWVNYVDGANIAGFVKVADAMLAQGVI
jgi:glutamate dehydrogenase (NADP+)